MTKSEVIVQFNTKEGEARIVRQQQKPLSDGTPWHQYVLEMLTGQDALGVAYWVVEESWDDDDNTSLMIEALLKGKHDYR